MKRYLKRREGLLEQKNEETDKMTLA